MVRTSLRLSPVHRERCVTGPKKPGLPHRSRHDAARQTAFVAVLALWWGAALATQYVAAQLGSRHRLGAGLFRVPAVLRVSVGVSLAVTAVAAMIALVSRGWRWACIPLTLVTASLFAALGDAIYPPSEVWRWYVAFGALPADRSAFRMAWAIVAGTVVLVTVAEPRVRHAMVRAMDDLRRPALVKAPTWPRRAVLPLPPPISAWRNGRASQASPRPTIPGLSPAPDPDASIVSDAKAVSDGEASFDEVSA